MKVGLSSDGIGKGYLLLGVMKRKGSSKLLPIKMVRQTGCGEVASLEDVLRHDGVLPAFGIDLAQQQIGDESAFEQLQSSCGDVGLVLYLSQFNHFHNCYIASE